MGKTVTEAQDIVQDVHESSQRYGLEISKDKTKVLLVAKEQRDIAIKIDDQKFQESKGSATSASYGVTKTLASHKATSA